MIGALLQELDLIVLLGDHPLDGGLGHQPHPVDLAAHRQGRIDPSDAAGVAVAVARGDLGDLPDAGVEGGDPGLVRILAEGQVAQGLGGFGVLGREQARAHVRDHLGAAVLVDAQHVADEVVGVQRPCDLALQEGADGLAGDPAHDLAQQIALVVDVVGGLGPRLPERLLLLERLHIGFPVEHGARVELVGGQDGDGGGVVQDVADQDAFLAVLGELRPVAGHRRVELHQPAVQQHVEADGGDPLGHRHHADQGVPLPGAGAILVGEAAPEIDHRPPVQGHRHGGAQLVLEAVVLQEGLDDALEPGIDGSREGVVLAVAAQAAVQFHGRSSGVLIG